MFVCGQIIWAETGTEVKGDSQNDTMQKWRFDELILDLCSEFLAFFPPSYEVSHLLPICHFP